MTIQSDDFETTSMRCPECERWIELPFTPTQRRVTIECKCGTRIQATLKKHKLRYAIRPKEPARDG